MKTFLWVFILGFTLSAQAAKIDDVTVLDVKYLKGSFEVKLQTKDGKKDSYFLVDIHQKDDKAFEKISLIWKKIKNKDFKLNLEIKSFSAHPSGAYYKSSSVTFNGTAEGESLF